MAYTQGNYYIGVDGKTYWYNGTKWEEYLLDGFPSGGTIAWPPTGALGIASGAFVPAVGQNVSSLQPISAGLESLESGSLRYPRDIAVSNTSHYILFDFYEYTPPFSSQAQNVAIGDQQSLNAYNATGLNGKKDSNLNQILLYMPEGVAASYKANWDGKAFGNAVAGILKNSGKGASGDYIGAIKGLADTASDAWEKAPAILGAQAVSSIAKRISGDSIGIQDIFSSVGGAILNPNVELIFGGHDLRTLQLTFKMVPYNITEAKVIRDIVKTFKQAMLPKFNGASSMTKFWSDTGNTQKDLGGNGNGFIAVPNLCKISFMQGSSESSILPKYKLCSITDFDVNYSPDGVYAVGPDGYPIATQITVNLMETKLVYAEDIDSGY